MPSMHDELMADGGAPVLGDTLGQRDDNGGLAELTITADNRDPVKSSFRYAERPRLQQTQDSRGVLVRRYTCKIACPPLSEGVLPLPERAEFALPDHTWNLNEDEGVEEGPETIISLARKPLVRETVNRQDA